MKKIPTLLVRDPRDRAHVTGQVTPGCEWVLTGEGTPIRKWDGTCTMLDESGAWWGRREVKLGKAPPHGWVDVECDEATGKRVGWEPIAASPFAGWHAQAAGHWQWQPGTYELCGPRINGNPERIAGRHLLIPHAGAEHLVELAGPRSVDRIAEVVRLYGRRGFEGVVWHHPDGRMAKLKARDLRIRTDGMDFPLVRVDLAPTNP